jgi:transposase
LPGRSAPPHLHACTLAEGRPAPVATSQVTQATSTTIRRSDDETPDLHSNNHFLTIIDEQDRRLLEKRLPNDQAITLRTLEPYRAEITGIAVESTFNWYWLVDGLAEAGYTVHLVNTSKARQYEGLKHTDDRYDAFWLAQQMRLGILPTGYIYPKAQRAVRDLLRERRRLVRQRTSNVLSTQSTLWRHTAIRLPSKVILGVKDAPWPDLPDQNVMPGVQAHRATINVLNEQIELIEATVLKYLKPPRVPDVTHCAGDRSGDRLDHRARSRRLESLRRCRALCILLSLRRRQADQ